MAFVLTRVHLPHTHMMCMLICTTQTWTSDLVLWYPSRQGQITALSWGKRPVLEMMVVIGCSVMIALGQLPCGVQ